MQHESCRMCGGDGRVGNAFGGSSTSCPSCNGTGRRSSSETVLRDVTKTKPSHHHPTGKAAPPVKQTWPSTVGGDALAKEIKNTSISDEMKVRLVQEIIDYEASHGKCTQTFTKKIRKRLRGT